MKTSKYKVKFEVPLMLSKMPTRSSISRKRKWQKMLQEDTLAISQLQYRMFAEDRQSLLIILQGMDGAGKDGTINHIMSGVNPQGVMVHSFKHPSDLELEHDFLWRHTQKLPEHGQITLFNRSQYENVLISKVHPRIVLAERLPGVNSIEQIDADFWAKRYRQINDYERNIVQGGTQILKFFLHMSAEEQCERFLERIENRERHWKFSYKDVSEREYWTDYQVAYEQAMAATSTKIAPWYIIPADNKWFAHALIGKIILKKLKEMNPTLPLMDEEESDRMRKAKVKLKLERLAFRS